MKRWKRRLRAVGAVLGLMGLVTFAEFIIEESFQTVMFGTWAAQDAGDWPTVKAGIDLMQRIERLQHYANYSIGWLQPLAFLSYQSYAQSERYYIRALRAKCFAHAPRLFIGEEIALEFTGFSVITQENEVWLERWPLRVRVKSLPNNPTLYIRGSIGQIESDGRSWVTIVNQNAQ